MKKRILICAVALALLAGLAGLTNDYYEYVPLADLYRIYGVPEVPAYMVLGIEPSTTLPPIDDNGLTVCVSDLATGEAVIPEAFSLEIAPILLYKKDITLRDYNKSPVFFNSRVSLATNSPDDGTRQAALGLRLKLVDQADPKGQFDKEWPAFFDQYDRDLRDYMNAWKEAHPDDANDEEAVENLMYQFDEDYGVNDRLSAMIQGSKDHWNKLRLELSTAVSAVSPDSLFGHAKFQAWQTWVSLSNSLGGSKTGQYILCPSVRLYRAEGKTNLDLNAPFRFVWKSPLVNSYFELQYAYCGKDKASLGSGTLGLYFQLSKGIWVDYQASYTADFSAGTSSLDHNLKIKYTLPAFLD